MTIKRIITVDTLDDLAEYIGLQAKEYEDSAADRKKTRARNPAYMTKTSIVQAKATAVGLRLAQRIVEDSEMS